ncbi:Ada metal-binding domain-containing protein [Pedobacter metabolipauper]|uniref:Metal binding Ada-like protein n=1 Tax=Pedobacter metabolipauper TaxID=425513 RepID=A0A4V3D140_9SPHI|nr:Ada metal-binding domain-containing protein [Pedobacter metabolipauper]TDQ08884.1 metal binding Ada-like protein [Pedobacter metabolipauper]
MILHIEISNADLRNKLKEKTIRFGGNCKLKIYGTLQCKSGKRMKRENRVFFQSEEDALLNSYRPCGSCMSSEYKKWKDGII